jgi:hypothetical protein
MKESNDPKDVTLLKGILEESHYNEKINKIVQVLQAIADE